jgi:putative ABC transport system permease protein
VTTLSQDIRYAVRMLARSPGFTAIAVATLALGIGANAAIFSVVNAVLLNPLPFERPGELVRVTGDLKGQTLADVGLSVPELFDYRDRSGIFGQISGLFPINANITGGDRPERAEVLLVDTNYFSMLGVRPEVGRFFETSDYRTGIAEIAVISDGWWRRHYGADPNVVGKTLRMDDDLYTIVGVTPAGFRHPGRSIETDVEIWSPAGWLTSPFGRAPSRAAYLLQGGLARLRPGLSVAAAQKQLDVFAEELRRQFSTEYPQAEGWTPRILPLQDDLVGNVRPALLVLMAAVGFVLLIACANVANLLLARASARRRELAIRQAMGAGRLRLVRQLLTESLVLALTGGALGLALSSWGVQLLLRLSPASLPGVAAAGPDARVLLFTLAASLSTGILFGTLPALQASGSGFSESLQDSARGSSTGRRGRRLRSVLVVAEFALALVLLVAAGLLVRTLWRLQQVDPGFDSKGVTMASLWLPQPNIPESGRYFKNDAQVTLYKRILERVGALPGVANVAASTRVPFGSNRGGGAFEIEGRDPVRGGRAGAQFASVSTGYFQTLRIPLVRGRVFTEQDEEKAMPVAVVSDSLVRKFFANEDPVGRRIRIPGRLRPGPWMTIVGVVRDVKTEALDALESPILYRPMLQASSLNMTLLVRGGGGPAALGAAIEKEIRAADPQLPIYGVRTMDEAMSSTVRQRRFAMRLLLLFAVTALLLSAIGVYGVIAFSVAQRRHEIGIRMALGARPGDVQRLLLTQGARLALAGVGIGLAGAFLLTGALSALLYGVSPRDPLTFGGIAALLTAVALLACYLPARGASRLDPIQALRSE